MTNEIFGTYFNGILVNYYANGTEKVSDHSDDESGLQWNGSRTITSARKKVPDPLRQQKK